MGQLSASGGFSRVRPVAREAWLDVGDVPCPVNRSTCFRRWIWSLVMWVGDAMIILVFINFGKDETLKGDEGIPLAVA